LVDLPGLAIFDLHSDFRNNRLLTSIAVNDNIELFWVGLAGSPKRVTYTVVNEEFPALSPDKQWVAYWPNYSGYEADQGAMAILNLNSGVVYKIGRLFWWLGSGISWSPVPALQIGATYQITGVGDELNLRQAPTRAGGALKVLHTGDTVTVLEGPVDADDYYWWRLRTADGVEGWAVEVAGWYAAVETPTP
jgi:hypothetical protein